MGLPELSFSLKKAAATVASRVSSGIVALILRDAKANGIWTIHRESDIPVELGEANAAALPIMLLYAVLGGAVIIGVIRALLQRLDEIDGGEEEEASRY